MLRKLLHDIAEKAIKVNTILMLEVIFSFVELLLNWLSIAF